MEIPASKGMRDKKYNQLIRWTTTGFVISNCFRGFCPFVLTKISTQSTWALKNDHSLSFGFGLFLHLRAWKRKGVSEPLLRTTTTFHALRKATFQCFNVLRCFGEITLTLRISLFDSTEKLIQRITEFMRSVLLCLSTIESEDCSNRFFSFFFLLRIPRDSKTPGFSFMFCLTDDHFIMWMLFGTLQVYMLLVYFKRNQPVDSSRDLFIPRSLSIVEGSPTTFESRSRGFTHSPSPKKGHHVRQHCQEGEISYHFFFPRCGFPKIFNATQRQTPVVFLVRFDLRSSKRGGKYRVGFTTTHPQKIQDSRITWRMKV